MTEHNNSLDTIVLGAGCFWCVEAVLGKFKGIIAIEPGYAGGHTDKPTYKIVCSETTGHAEVVKVTFDPQQIALEDILKVFFIIHDPTTLNAQGADIGTRYRSTILVKNETQSKIASTIKNEIIQSGIWNNPIVTTIEPLEKFYPAEEEHKNYFELHPESAYCQAVIAPKVIKIRKEFTEFLKK